MGHYMDAVEAAARNYVNEREKAREQQQAIEIKEPVLDEVIKRDRGLDETLTGFIKERLPEREIPEGEEFKKLEERRQKAFQFYSEGAKRKREIFLDAVNTYGQAGQDGEPRQSPFTVDERTEITFIPYTESDEVVKQYLKDYLGEGTTPATRRRMMLQNMKKMVQKAQNNPLLDLQQDEDYLLEHYWEMYTLTAPSVQMGGYIETLIGELKKEVPPAITEEEEKDYRALKDQVDHIFNIYSTLTARLDIMLNPVYPFIGDSRLSDAERKIMKARENISDDYKDEDDELITEIDNLIDNFGVEIPHIDGIETLKPDMTELRNGLKRRTRGDESYKNVENALEDYLEICDDLSPEENLLLLRQIGKLADTYLSGNHAPDRISAMRDFAHKLHGQVDSVEGLMQRGQLAEKTGKKLENDEPLLRTLRRSMKNQPFDADTFALWKAADEYENRFAHVAEIRNSDAVRFMNENLEGNVKDEKELNRIYEVTEKAIGDIKGISKLDAKQFIARYNEILAGRDKTLKTGNDAFDKALQKKMMREMNRAALRRELDIVPGKPALTGPDHEAYSYGMRDRMLLALSDGKLKEYNKLETDMARAEQQTRATMADTVFRVDYKALANMMPSAFRQRDMPFVVTTAFLMDQGLSLDEIFDPKARCDDKRALGDNLMKLLKSAQAGGKDMQQALFDRIARSLAEHGDEMLDYKTELSEHKDVDHENETIRYAESRRILLDGIFDAFSQSVVKSDIWSPAHKEHSLAMFRRDNEPEEQTMARIEELSARINVQHAESGFSDKIINLKSRIYGKMSSGNDTFDRNDLRADCNSLLACSKLSSVLTGMNTPATQDERALFAIFNSYLETMIQPFQNLLRGCPPQVFLALATDPALQERFRVVANPDFIQTLPGENRIEKQDNLFTDLQSDFKRFGYFVLRDKAGNELKVSPEMLKGGGSPEEKAFLSRFNSEIIEYCVGKERNAARNTEQTLAKDLKQLPAQLRDCKNLFTAAPDSMNLITKKLNEFVIRTNNKKTGDPLANIIIGERNGKQLMKAEVARRGLKLSEMKNTDRYILFASICAAALKKGLKVSLVGPNAEPTINDFNKPAEIQTLTLTDELKNSKAADASLSAVWKGVGGFFENRKTEAENTRAHQSMVNLVNLRVSGAMDKQYMDLRPDLKRISTLNTIGIAAGKKSFTTMITASLGKHARTAGDYPFRKGSSLSRDSAIMAIAYAQRSQDYPNMTTRLSYYCEPAEMEIRDAVLKKAAETYARIMENHEKHPAESEREMRKYMVQGLQAMSKTDGPDPDADMKDYVAMYAADFKARRDLLNQALTDSTPLGVGKTRAEKGRTMKDFLKNMEIQNQDLAALEYLSAAEKAEKIYQCENVTYNMQALQQAVCRHAYFMKGLASDSNAIPFDQFTERYKEAQDYAKEIVSTSMVKPNKKDDFATTLKSALVETNEILQMTRETAAYQKEHAQEKQKQEEIQMRM